MKKCPCCESEKVFIKFQKMWDKSYFVDGKFSLLECEKCQMIFLEPKLNEKELSKYYPAEEYYSFHNKNNLAITYHKISAYYHSRRNFLFNLLFYPMSPLLYTYYIQPGKNVLEIGCGDGMKLKIYREYGMKTNGLEPYGQDLTAEEKKVGIIRKSIEDAPYEKNSFDIIILKEVLEHVPEQKKVLEKCQGWLKPRGKIIITVPNTEGTWAKIFKENWFGYDVPRHLYNYNPRNIQIMLEKFKFKINKIRVYEPPYMFDGSLKFYMANKTGKKEHPFIFSNGMKILSMPLSLIVTKMKKGSLMEIECTKEQ